MNPCNRCKGSGTEPEQPRHWRETRAARILGALAGCAEPVSTTQLIEMCGEGDAPVQRAQTWFGNALRRQERKGRVKLSGWAESGRAGAQLAQWVITDTGREYLATRLAAKVSTP